MLTACRDADVKTLDPIVRGQADIREISNDTLPLWFDGLDPAKVNFGLAYYGRGYTLSDASCNTLNCPFSGPSDPGKCTNFPGVMSLREIDQVIEERKLTPTLLPESMMKQITWADQWIGYDDADTIKLKKAWADGQCFGGTMAWSIDFDSGVGRFVTRLARLPAVLTLDMELTLLPVAIIQRTQLTARVAPLTVALFAATGLTEVAALPQDTVDRMLLTVAMDVRAEAALWVESPQMAPAAQASLPRIAVTGLRARAVQLPATAVTTQLIVER